MSYTVPTRSDFIARFPVFADKDGGLIDRLLVEASGSVDDSWVEGDYQNAILYLTAHLLATDASSEDDSVEIGMAGGGALTSESFGGMSASYAAPSFAQGSLSSNDQYGTTEYGRRFLALLKRNVGGPFVA